MSTITTTTTTTTTRKSASIMNLASLVTSYGPDSPPIPRLQTTASAPAVTPKSHSRTYDQYRERKTPTSPYSSTTFGMSATFASSISPRMPLSPPAEDRRKWSLPSISSLLEGAAADASLPSASKCFLFSFARNILVNNYISCWYCKCFYHFAKKFSISTGTVPGRKQCRTC